MANDGEVASCFGVEYQQENKDALLTSPHHRLPTLTEIKLKIPGHCFRSSVRKSTFYAMWDVFVIALVYTLMVQLECRLKCGYLLYPLYWYVQGTLYMALFSLGHDCAHASFTSYPLFNDTIGTFLFTWILIPYYPWKITHKSHHKNTGNIDKDEAYYPLRSDFPERSWTGNIFLWTPGLLWFHYLVRGYSPRNMCHFNPFHSPFAKHWIGVSLSLSAYAAKLYLMFIYATRMGITSLILHHLIPIFVFATYLAIVTLLHHTEINVPWYVDDQWSHIKGQLSTVDRDYGYIHSVIHSIGTHQIHHLFPKIPHYHLEEATAHFRKAFPHLVRLNHNRILPSFLRMSRTFIQQRNIRTDVPIFTFSDNRTSRSE